MTQTPTFFRSRGCHTKIGCAGELPADNLRMVAESGKAYQKMSEMSKVERMKFLFTGEVPVSKDKGGPVDPGPFSPERAAEVFRGYMTTKDKIDEWSASYTTFAGCDVKAVFVHGVGDDPTRDELLYAGHPSYGKTCMEAVTTGGTYHQEHSMTLGELQAISLRSVLQGERKTEGTLIAILFDRSLLERLEMMEGPIHLLLLAANEYGDMTSMAIPNIRLEEVSWGISVDDLISEEHYRFSGGPLMHWKWVRRSYSDRLAEEREDGADNSEQ